MYKISYELFKVHKYFRVKFCVIYNKEIDKGNPNFCKTIHKFTFNGNDYLKFNPYPFLTIDINSNLDKKEDYDMNSTFNMNRRELFIFKSRLKRLYKSFVEEKELFYYDEESKLKVNINIAEKCKEQIVCSNKRILLQACVVEDENTNKYEGIFLCVNTMDTFTYLTYGDMEYLLYELDHIDMTALAIDTLNSAILLDNLEKEVIERKKSDPVIEELQQEINEVKKSIYIQQRKEIPEEI